MVLGPEPDQVTQRGVVAQGDTRCGAHSSITPRPLSLFFLVSACSRRTTRLAFVERGWVQVVASLPRANTQPMETTR